MIEGLLFALLDETMKEDLTQQLADGLWEEASRLVSSEDASVAIELFSGSVQVSASMIVAKTVGEEKLGTLLVSLSSPTLASNIVERVKSVPNIESATVNGLDGVSTSRFEVYKVGREDLGSNNTWQMGPWGSCEGFLEDACSDAGRRWRTAECLPRDDGACSDMRPPSEESCLFGTDVCYLSWSRSCPLGRRGTACLFDRILRAILAVLAVKAFAAFCAGLWWCGCRFHNKFKPPQAGRRKIEEFDMYADFTVIDTKDASVCPEPSPRRRVHIVWNLDMEAVNKYFARSRSQNCDEIESVCGSSVWVRGNTAVALQEDNVTTSMRTEVSVGGNGTDGGAAFRVGDSIEYYSTENARWIHGKVEAIIAGELAPRGSTFKSWSSLLCESEDLGKYTDDLVYDVRVGSLGQLRRGVRMVELRLPFEDGEAVELDTTRIVMEGARKAGDSAYIIAQKAAGTSGNRWRAAVVEHGLSRGTTLTGYRVRPLGKYGSKRGTAIVASSHLRVRFAPGDRVLVYQDHARGWQPALALGDDGACQFGLGRQPVGTSAQQGAAEPVPAPASFSSKKTACIIDHPPLARPWAPQLWTWVPIRILAEADDVQLVPSYRLRRAPVPVREEATGHL